MKCKTCGKEINSIYIHEVYLKSLDSVCGVSDLYSDHNYFIETTFHCPECYGSLYEEEIMLHIEEKQSIKKAEEILIDNGIDPDDRIIIVR